MGRWAQRTRAGGTVNQFNRMTVAHVAVFGNDSCDVTYANPLNAAALTASDFSSQPSTEGGASISQLSANVIRITFSNPVDTDTSLDYGGNAVGFITPDSIAYT